MSKFQNKYRIESARLNEWDYSKSGLYYVTFNTKNHNIWFGEIKNGKMILNQFGKIAGECWNETPNHYPSIELDYYVIMPNHVHGIIIINDNNPIINVGIIDYVETGHAPSLRNQQQTQPQQQKHSPTLANIIGSYKSAVTKKIHEIGIDDFGWQPRFYDRIIRDEKELFRVRKYIEQNPVKWEMDNE